MLWLIVIIAAVAFLGNAIIEEAIDNLEDTHTTLNIYE